MTAANKRPPVLVGGEAAAMLDDMPKAMLADLVADLLRASLGEDVTDAELCDAIAAAAGPVAHARRWRIPRRPRWQR